MTYSITHNNHYQPGYNDNFEHFRKLPDDIWRVKYGSISREPKTWREECINSAKLIRDEIDGPLVVFLSGGIDSEAMLLSFYLAGIPVSVVIIRLEDNYNAHDIYFAINMCEQFGIKYNIINIDVVKLWEDVFWSDYSQFQMVSPMTSVPMYVIDNYTDGVPVIGMGDSYVERTPATNDYYTVFFEFDTAVDKFFNERERIGIASFFQYTPEQVLSFFNSNQYDKFMKTSKRIRLSSITPWKWLIYNEHFPEIKPKLKHHGYEIVYGLSLTYGNELAKKFMYFRNEITIPYDEYIKSLRGEVPFPHQDIHRHDRYNEYK